MQQQGQFILMNRQEFKDWLFKTKFNRYIVRIQNHHTWEPSYNDFNNNHFSLLNGMKSYHVDTMGYGDIAQNLTTFPDGLIAVCRSFELKPAGIYGANTAAICIENIGNFDSDTMTDEQKKTIVFINAVLCQRFNLKPSTDTIVYHHWYDLNTGVRTNGSGSTKTCPGTMFFGGNTVEAANAYFIPLIKQFIERGDSMTAQEAIQKLVDKGIITAPDYWLSAINIVKNLDTLFIKIAEKI